MTFLTSIFGCASESKSGFGAVELIAVACVGVLIIYVIARETRDG